jgi:hypothetical protein
VEGCAKIPHSPPFIFIGYSMVEMLKMAINKYKMAIEPYTKMFMWVKVQA